VISTFALYHVPVIYRLGLKQTPTRVTLWAPASCVDSAVGGRRPAAVGDPLRVRAKSFTALGQRLMSMSARYCRLSYVRRPLAASRP